MIVEARKAKTLLFKIPTYCLNLAYLTGCSKKLKKASSATSMNQQQSES
jgi:hypothetical protein